MKKVLVFSSKPPTTYTKALQIVNARFDCVFAPNDLSSYGGLLLTGGGDVLPAFYGGSVPSSAINFIRDEAELKVVDYFVKNDLPILGICRGAQILNVYFGGKLSCVEDHFDETRDIYHDVISLSPNAFLPNFKAVNSCHKQRCYPLAPCAKPLLVAEDGTVEAFSAGKNVLAVQFHPERMNDSAIKAVYGKFVDKVFGAKPN